MRLAVTGTDSGRPGRGLPGGRQCGTSTYSHDLSLLIPALCRLLVLGKIRKKELPMPPMTATQSTLESLKDLTRLVQKAEGFHPLVAALQNGHGATVDGAWGSSSALVAAALGLHAPRTLVVVIAFPRDVDG